jgi:hypothetical protein
MLYFELTGSPPFSPKHEQKADLLPRVTLASPSKSAPVLPLRVFTSAPLSPWDRMKLCRALEMKLRPLMDDLLDLLDLTDVDDGRNMLMTELC